MWLTPGVTSLKKSDSPSPSSYKFPISPQLVVGIGDHSLLLPAVIFLWLEFMQILCLHSQSLWAFMFNYPVVFWQYCLSVVIYHFWLLESFISIFMFFSANTLTLNLKGWNHYEGKVKVLETCCPRLSISLGKIFDILVMLITCHNQLDYENGNFSFKTRKINYIMNKAA